MFTFLKSHNSLLETNGWIAACPSYIATITLTDVGVWKWVLPTLIKFKEYDSGSCPTLMKLRGWYMYLSLWVTR